MDLIKKRILIVGSNGMLGQRLTDSFKSNGKIELMCASAESESFTDNVEYSILDISDKKSVKNIVMNFYPDIIVNSAGYTNVDGCETNKDTAYQVNVKGAEYLSHYAKVTDAHLIHISSDYIFDGRKGRYTEDDLPNPVSYYGRTKLAGENAVRSQSINFTIIRTNVLYGPARHGRPDFVKWTVNSLRGNQKIRIVTDQVNNPTFLDDLVTAIHKFIDNRKYGIFNIGGPEFLSRFDFTLRIADFFDLNKKLIEAIVTSQLNQLAPRPLNSGLVIRKAGNEIGYVPHNIEDSFAIMKKELNL